MSQKRKNNVLVIRGSVYTQAHIDFDLRVMEEVETGVRRDTQKKPEGTLRCATARQLDKRDSAVS